MARKSKGFEWAYRDLLIAMLVVFMALAALASTPKNNTHAEDSHGLLLIDMSWDLSRDADIDLWLKTPQGAPIGYSHRSGANCDLLRDDTGRSNDPSSRNKELIACRTTPAGEYIVNVVVYSSHDSQFPIPATITLTRTNPNSTGGTDPALLRKTVSLVKSGQELTVWRFRLDETGNLVPGSVNEAPRSLSGTH